MTKPNTVDTILDDVQNHALHYTDGETDILANQRQLAHKQIYKEMLGVIDQEKDLFFDKTYPVFNSLEEYIDHVILLRKTLRAEQRLALNKLFGMEE